MASPVLYSPGMHRPRATAASAHHIAALRSLVPELVARQATAARLTARGGITHVRDIAPFLKKDRQGRITLDEHMMSESMEGHLGRGSRGIVPMVQDIIASWPHEWLGVIAGGPDPLRRGDWVRLGEAHIHSGSIGRVEGREGRLQIRIFNVDTVRTLDATETTVRVQVGTEYDRWVCWLQTQEPPAEVAQDTALQGRDAQATKSKPVWRAAGALSTGAIDPSAWSPPGPSHP